MEVIDEAMKKLRRTLRKPESNKESLELIDKVEKAAAKSKDLVPALAAKKPEADRPKFVENYKKDMDAFIKSVGEMKAAVKAGQERQGAGGLQEPQDAGRQGAREVHGVGDFSDPCRAAIDGGWGVAGVRRRVPSLAPAAPPSLFNPPDA